jgi:hypothetical protein
MTKRRNTVTDIVSAWRDARLKPSRSGLVLVATFCTVSPALVEILKRNVWLMRLAMMLPTLACFVLAAAFAGQITMRGRHLPALLAAAVLAAAAFAGESRAMGYPNGPMLRMPGELAGKVIHVDDGDTLTVLDADNFQRVVRLTDIDAPESEHGSSFPGQPFSGRATALLKSLTLGR